MKNFLHEFFGNIAVRCMKKGGAKNIERSFKWVKLSMIFATNEQREYFVDGLEKMLQTKDGELKKTLNRKEKTND